MTRDAVLGMGLIVALGLVSLGVGVFGGLGPGLIALGISTFVFVALATMGGEEDK